MLKINGVETDAAGMSVSAYLAAAGYAASRVAVEKNGRIVPKKDYDVTFFSDGDIVEIVSFVGGG